MAERLGILDRLKKLDEERATLVETAKTEALQKAQDAVADLNALGFNYRLVDGTEGARLPRAVGTGAKRQSKGEACPICGVKTDPPHDRRAHKKNPEPFTPEQLEARGMKVVN